MTQGRVKTKEISQLVLNTTTGLPLSSTFCIILLSISVFTLPPHAESELLSADTGVKHRVSICFFLYILSSEFLSARTGG